MGRPKRVTRAAAEESGTPPDGLTPAQSIARVVKAEGNNLYSCTLPNTKPVLVELADRFRNTVWIKRGGYVLVEASSAEERKNSRVLGEIVNVVRDEREWRKQPYWPKEFIKTSGYDEDEDDDSSAGKLPPSDSEEEEDQEEAT